MASSIEMLKIDLVDQLEYMARAQLGPNDTKQASAFVRALYAHVPPSDLVAQRPEPLVTAALSLYRFAKDRKRGRASLRIYNPSNDSHGWSSEQTIIEVVNDDMPFLVDSMRGALERFGSEIQLLVHPILQVARDEGGHLSELAEAPSPLSGSMESVMHVRIARVAADEHPRLEHLLRAVLDDVRQVVTDFEPMRERCKTQAQMLLAGVSSDPERAQEAAQFLSWLADDHFTYQGYSYCRFERAPLSSRPPDLEDFGPPSTAPGVRFDRERGLGILRDAARSMFDVFEPPRKRELIRILKANRHSTVHRTVHLDTVIVSDFDAQGALQGAHMFVGLFTASAYAAPAPTIPLLHHKIERVVAQSGFIEPSHNVKMLRYILSTYPRDELFQISDADLYSISLGIFHLQYRQRVALFIRRDPFGRFVSCLVYLPRDRMDTELRLRIQDILVAAFNGSLSAYYPEITDAPLARLHLIIKTPSGTPERMDFVALERKVEHATRSWHDRLKRMLPSELGEERGALLAERYGHAFPASYREDFDDIVAVSDIEYIEHAISENKLTLQLYRAVDAPEQELRFKIFSPNGYVALSDVHPILENLGLRVLGEVPYELHVKGLSQPIWLHDFSMLVEGDVPAETPQLRDAFTAVFSATWEKRMDDDGFNKLVLHAGLSARQVVLLRACAKYLRQIQVPFSEGYMQQTLRKNPKITRALVELFESRFDPVHSSVERCGQLRAELLANLDAVVSLDEDRILRLFLDLVEATTRTNFFQVDEHGAPRDHLAFKIESGRMPAVPRPAPFREIFVSGPRTEGVHLRFGEVARGGLRWSDRLEDFRTEILGLAKAQQVKNAVIVPVGSKGGFVVKRPPPANAGRDALIAEGIACYEIFIESLLDLTDNRRWNVASDRSGQARPEDLPPTDEIVPPDNTVRHDPPDPYLVVAADKGTATFSDIANAISQRRNFWLDDAFASGGSAGYDHKQMGITARGAWESIKRHFRELDKNIQTQPFTCAGVGDMSGDVFGNGLLLSQQTRLIAAFDHRHIFLDPTPNVELSWKERSRLFQLSRSSWDDYNRELISQGGGVYPRSAKRIELSPEVRASLGINALVLTPGELIMAILQAPVELLFFGGIGTYVRGRSETDAQAGDRSNDAHRIDASQLRCSVVGEGANLALTQRARIEFCQAGGRCNSDFIDNSAGVDCSDHEVNIKILLSDVERRAGMTRQERNDILRTMTDEVSQLVLRDTYLQTQSLSVTTQLSHHLTDRIARSMRAMEKSGHLNRRLESLPDDETLADRQRVGQGFFRPELCVLMAYAKNSLSASLLATDLPDTPLLERDLIEYFPSTLRERFKQSIVDHRLRREITSTVITNEIVNRLGVAFANEVSEATGASSSDLVLAYVAAREIVDIREIWGRIEALDNQVPASVQSDLLVEGSRLVERVTVWLLREHGGNAAQNHVGSYRAGVATLAAHLPALITGPEAEALNQRVTVFTAQGVDDDLARRVCSLRQLLPAVDIVRVAELAAVPLSQASSTYFGVGRYFGFDWLRSAAQSLPTLRSWDRQAVATLRDELFSIQKDFTLAVLGAGDAQLPPDRRIEAWVTPRRSTQRRCEQLLSELRATPSVDFAMLTVAARQLQGLLSAGTLLSAPPPPSMVRETSVVGRR